MASTSTSTSISTTTGIASVPGLGSGSPIKDPKNDQNSHTLLKQLEHKGSNNQQQRGSLSGHGGLAHAPGHGLNAPGQGLTAQGQGPAVEEGGFKHNKWTPSLGMDSVEEGR